MMSRLILLGLLFNFSVIGTVSAADVEARVGWSQRIDMSTTVSGVVDEVRVNEGDRVSKGDILLRLQADRFKAALSSAQAAKKNAQYKLKEAEREWNRAQELYDRTVLSDHDLQLAENGLISAKAVFAHASANQTNAKRDVEESVIRAPFDAVVLARHAHPGQTIVTRMQSVALISVAATKNYHAKGAVPISSANKLASGQAVSVTVNGKRFNGILSSVGYEPEKDTGAYPVVVRFTTGASLLRAGQSATLHLP